MAFELPQDEKAQISILPLNKLGQYQAVEGVSYSSSDESIAIVDQTGLVTPLAQGEVTFAIRADAQLGAGEIILEEHLAAVVVPARAVALQASIALV